MNNPLVTIVAICYNHEDYCIQTLESIKNQTYKNWELYIVDDFSTDESAKKINHWINDNKNINPIFISNTYNQGICSSLNKTIPLAIGKYIALIACDDIMLNDRIHKQVYDLEEKKSDYALTCSNVNKIDENGAVIGIEFDSTFNFPYSNVFDSILINKNDSGIIIHSPTVLAKTEIIKSFLPYPSHIIQEDLYMWLCISAKYKISYLSDPLTKYRVLPNSLSRDPIKKEALLLDRIIVANEFITDYPDKKQIIQSHNEILFSKLIDLNKRNDFFFYTRKRYVLDKLRNLCTKGLSREKLNYIIKLKTHNSLFYISPAFFQAIYKVIRIKLTAFFFKNIELDK